MHMQNEGEENKMIVKLIGTGCGSTGTMTIDAREALESADLIIGAQRLLDSLPDEVKCRPDVIRHAAVLPEKIMEFIDPAADRNICVVFSGDTGFYSGTRRLLPLLEDAGIEPDILPGISSVQIMSARLGEPWQDWILTSAHGVDADPVCEVMKGKPVFFLTGGKLGPADICAQLAEAGLEDLRVTVGERLSYDDEKITEGTAAELAGKEFGSLSVILVRPAPCCGDMTPGIEDDMFIRGDVPMTKQAIRASIISNMRIKKSDTVWDVGAGTGSVSVEMAMKASGGRVYAVERREEGCRLIRENRRKFGCWNICTVQGDAPGALGDLPVPDKVFIGGSGGSIKEIIDLVLDKNERAVICVTAIVIETLNDTLEAMTARGLDVSIMQLAASRTRKTGGRHMMAAENPIFIITGAADV